ncbi:MAG: hypothetical protein CSA89_00035 [Bacteroidales bacterium]|nr:MAG: hypothetical protein CSA89_00035 [Bacteroidales bacterium]
MKKFRLFEVISGWGVFVVAAITYLMTIEPSASFWDCGEFIAAADKLEPGHPPGAPLFMLLGRICAILTTDATQVARMINSFSAICSALTILFLFWTITHLAKKIVCHEGQEMSYSEMFGILGAGVVGSLAYTFSDTFWFSAVEGEVYAFSSFFTAIVFWAILRWERTADDDTHGERWILLIAYLMGLSVGVHLLNLLAIPAIVLVYYFKKTEQVEWKGLLKAIGVSFVVIIAVLYGLIPGITKVAGVFELFFTNTLGLPFNSGSFVYLALVTVALVWSIYESHRAKNPIAIKTSFMLMLIILGVPFVGNGVVLGLLLIVAGVGLLFYKKDWDYRWFKTISLSLLLMVVGCSSYAVVMIRSAANPPMDQNSPEDIFSLRSYLAREQYGDRPLFYGESFASPVVYEPSNDGRCFSKLIYGNDDYIRKIKDDKTEKDSYINVGKVIKGVDHTDNSKMLFPRMYSSQPHHINAYKQWCNFKGKRINAEQCGQMQPFVVPTMSENIKFFFSYQLNFMYWRYFMWNFVGRQNDIQSNNGELDAGQWISGIPFIDNALYGDQSKLPDYMKNNKGHNRYFFLPLILGLLGIFWQLSNAKKGSQQFWITLSLFFMTGIAIVIYLNQTPYQPRERDYAYAGSFYAFSIWIGLGMLAVVKFLQRAKLSKSIATILAFVISMGVPVLMASQNWDDHDRSDRFVCRDIGYDYLNSCAKNSILFCNGDNDTFPLWYSQEVEGVRDDIRTCNLSYISASWYIDQMKRGYYNSQPLQIDLADKEYQKGSLDFARVIDHPIFGGKIDINTAFEILRTKETQEDNKGVFYASTITIPVDKQRVIDMGVVAPEEYDDIVDTIELNLDGSLGKGDIAVLNMLKNNDWSRPIYFCVTIGSQYYPSQSISQYLQIEGLASRFVPVVKKGEPNTVAMYDNMMNKFKYSIKGKNIYLDETTSRSLRTVRQSFSQLAISLIKEGDTVRAKEVLDRGIEELPEALLHYDLSMLQYIEGYYKLGDYQSADDIMSKLMNNIIQNLIYVASLPKEKQNYVSQSMNWQFNLGMLQHCAKLSEEYKSSMSNKVKKEISKYYTVFGI